MKVGDKIIITSVAAVVLISAICVFALKKGEGYVTVKQNNKTVYYGSLNKDYEVKLDTNTVVIKNKKVYMLDSDCKNQICVNTGEISKKGESIVCLPNRVTAEIN